VARWIAPRHAATLPAADWEDEMRFAYGLLLALLALPGAAHAQSSQRPLQIIVPFAPGGSADGIGRILATELSAKLGRQVYVDNRPGAGGSLGLTVLAKAAPDGDTVAIAATGALVINPHVPGSTGFDPVKELAPVAKLIEIPLLVVANPKIGPKTVKEMIEQSKARPAGLSYGSTGVNSSQHLSVEMFKKVTGANLVHIPYRGSGPAALAAVAGDVPLTSTDLTAAHENVKAGNLIALGITSLNRSKLAPDIPTLAEGGVPGFSGAPGFIGMVAPLGTPPAVIRQLSSEIATIVARPDVQAKIATLSVEPAYADEAAFGAALVAESTKIKEIVKTLQPSQ
jgi:tripartite-type tricarboxylate transporter receptor subunit TctC